MSDLDSIVTVTITAETLTPDQAAPPPNQLRNQSGGFFRRAEPRSSPPKIA